MKKGFTLVELLGSIVILAVIALVAFPAVLNLLSSSQTKIDDSMKDYAIESTRQYVFDHLNSYEKKSSLSKNVSIETLINEGYISDNIINNKNKEMKNDYVTVGFDGTKYVFTYHVV